MESIKKHLWSLVTVLVFISEVRGSTIRRKRSYTPDFGNNDNLSFRGCGTAVPSAKAVDEEFPWLVKVTVDDKFTPKQCFGVVISDKAVLTSAFCASAEDTGKIKVAFTKEFNSPGLRVPDGVQKHPDYDLANMKNNLAVLSFQNDISQFGAKPICLWNKQLTNGEKIISNDGIGTIVARKRDLLEELVKTEYQVENTTECKNLIKPANRLFLENNNICTKYIGSCSECISGFGAPLQVKIGNRWFLRGIYNVGIRSHDTSLPCHSSHVISFTDTARYANFITSRAQLKLNNPSAELDKQNKLAIYSYPRCGTRSQKFSNKLIHYGESTDIEDYPWLAAIFKGQNNEPAYICGGALISRNYVLTAAHCLFEPLQKVVTSEKELVVYFGKTFLSRGTSDEGIQSKSVRKIIIPDTYNIGNDHDIGLIKLKTEVTITKTVSTICLWAGPSALIPLSGRIAELAGWGKTGEGSIADQLQKTKLPIIKNDVCKSYKPQNAPNYFQNRLNTGHKFCAGYTNGTSPCNGDSGSPLIMKENDVYYIRGIVSESVVNQDNRETCNTNFPAIFTDVAGWREWIISKTSGEVDYYYEK